MDWRKVSDYLETQSKFAHKRCMESTSIEEVRRWATLADLYMTFACAFFIGISPDGWDELPPAPHLGDVEDKLAEMK